MLTLILVLFLILSVVITHLSVKRMNRKSNSEKSGYLTYVYAYLLVAAILGIGITSFIFAGDTLVDLSKGIGLDSYEAKVINYEMHISEKPYNNPDGKTRYRDVLMKAPTVEFITKTNDTIVKELDFSSEKLRESYTVKYNEKTGEVIVWGFVFVLKLAVSILFSFIFGGLIIGLFIYVSNGNIKKYINKFISITLQFFIPFLIVGLEALLIYGFFQMESSESFWVKALLIFFIMALAAVILGFAYAFWQKIRKRYTTNIEHNHLKKQDNNYDI